MEIKINREIRNYTKSMFFELSMRQFIFSVLAMGIAVGLYFVLKPNVGTGTVIVLKKPKTEGSIRTVFIPDTVVVKHNRFS